MLTDETKVNMDLWPVWARDIYENSPHLLTILNLAAITHMTTGSLHNLHSEGRAPAGSFMMGKKRVFPRFEAVQWLIKRAQQDKAV